MTRKIIYFVLISFLLSFSFIACDEETIEDLLTDSLATLDSTDISLNDSTNTDDDDDTDDSDDDTDDSDDSDDDTNSSELNLDKDKILKLVNDHRAAGTDCSGGAKGTVAAVTWNDKLAEAAIIHTKDMFDNIGTLNHTGSDGSSVGQRVTRVGYNWSAVAENIAKGQTSEEAVIQAWMNSSSGHCDAIMNGTYTEIGVARSETGNYWTMVLGRGN